MPSSRFVFSNAAKRLPSNHAQSFVTSTNVPCDITSPFSDSKATTACCSTRRIPST